MYSTVTNAVKKFSPAAAFATPVFLFPSRIHFLKFGIFVSYPVLKFVSNGDDLHLIFNVAFEFSIESFLSECDEIVGDRGSAPDPAGGAYDAPPDPLVEFLKFSSANLAVL